MISVTSQPVEAGEFFSSRCWELRLMVLSWRKAFPTLILTKHGLILRHSNKPIWKYKSDTEVKTDAREIADEQLINVNLASNAQCRHPERKKLNASITVLF